MKKAIEAIWIAAVLAPSTIAPHPNFPPRTVQPAEVLALISQRRHYRELERFALADATPSQLDFLELVKASLIDSSQAESIDPLISRARQGQAAPGLRAAAAIYAAVALAELDRTDEAAVMLQDVATSLSGRRSPGECPSSLRLVVAAVLQQRVLRLQERSDVATAEAIEAVLEWLPPAAQGDFETFSVSSGIAWGSRRVQLDIVASIKYHALLAQSSLDWTSGGSWTRVVKTRTAWIDSRLNIAESDRDQLVLRDAFEREVESTSRTRHFMRSSASDEGYTALLLAELSGHAQRVWRCREALGKVLFLESKDDPHVVRESLRLLRQGRSTGPLQSVVLWVRNQGPIESLRDQASRVLDRSGRWTSEEDLIVLEGASDFLSDADLLRAVEVVLRYATSEHAGYKASWSVLDRMWRALGRLVPGSGSDDRIAREAFTFANQPDLISTGGLASTVAQVLALLDWRQVKLQTRSLWREWVTDKSDLSDGQSELRDQVVASLGLRIDPQPGVGLELAAQLADGLVEATEERLKLARASIFSALERDAHNAESGMIEWGGYEGANVAVAFALSTGDEEVWRKTADYLTTGVIDGSLKARALDRVAANATRLPLFFITELSNGWSEIANGRRRDSPFSDAVLPVFAEAIRVGIALRILTWDEVIPTILKLCSAGDASRVAAARTLRFAIGLGEPAWAFATLLQLAEDPNPEVRGEASHSLVLGLGAAGSLRDLVALQIEKRAAEPGVRVPLSILYAVQRTADDKGRDPFVLGLCETLLTHSARVVREAAAVAIERLALNEG